MRTTMAWVIEGRLGVAVHGPMPPSHEDWLAFVAEVAALKPVGDRRFIVLSHGGAPDGAQRKLLVDAFGGQVAPCALLTQSLLVRGVGIAISWFNTLLRVFTLDQVESAFGYLELSPAERFRAQALMRRLHYDLRMVDAHVPM